MSGRANWYSDHPPACTCAQCRTGAGPGRRGRSRREQPRRGPSLFKPDISWPRSGQQQNKRGPVTLFLVTLVLLLVIGVAVAYQQGYLHNLSDRLPVSLSPLAMPIYDTHAHLGSV